MKHRSKAPKVLGGLSQAQSMGSWSKKIKIKKKNEGGKKGKSLLFCIICTDLYISHAR